MVCVAVQVGCPSCSRSLTILQLLMRRRRLAGDWNGQAVWQQWTQTAVLDCSTRHDRACSSCCSTVLAKAVDMNSHHKSTHISRLQLHTHQEPYMSHVLLSYVVETPGGTTARVQGCRKVSADLCSCSLRKWAHRVPSVVVWPRFFQRSE